MKISGTGALAFVRSIALLSSVALLSACSGGSGGGGSAGTTPPPPQMTAPVQPSQPTGPSLTGEIGPRDGGAGVFQRWMHPEVQSAWEQRYTGQGATITVVDDFSGDTLRGNTGAGTLDQTHGAFVRDFASRTAFDATIVEQSFTGSEPVVTPGGTRNIINASYGVFIEDIPNTNWEAKTASIIAAGQSGTAVVVKAAGNDGTLMTAPRENGLVDGLNRDLAGGQSVLFAGALERHGTTSDPASIASYSNTPGDDPALQKRYLTVGVDSQASGLAGTSFAAPQISGYAAIVGSKFTSATPAQISGQLLDTARTDTIRNYNPAVHGRGEASLSRALAPVSLQ